MQRDQLFRERRIPRRGAETAPMRRREGPKDRGLAPVVAEGRLSNFQSVDQRIRLNAVSAFATADMPSHSSRAAMGP